MAERDTLGPFEIEREIGRGGSSVVFAARRHDAGGAFSIALKVPHGELTEREAKRFLEEAERLARVKHSSIVVGLDAGLLPDGRPYLAMPLLAGEPLSARIARGKLPVAACLQLFGPLADAVACLHEQGLVHRDIKPENTFYVEEEERLVLLDFGIARDVNDGPSTTTNEGVVRGTMATMAPERFFGAPATPKSDVYELAVLLFAMLTGRLPWDEASDMDRRLSPPRPDELGVALPEPVVVALMESLSTREDRRPTARELEARLRSIDLAGTSPGAERETRDLLREPAKSSITNPTIAATPPSPTTSRRTAVLGITFAVLTSAAIAFSTRAPLQPAHAEARLARLLADSRLPLSPTSTDVSSAAGAEEAPPEPRDDAPPVATSPSTATAAPPASSKPDDVQLTGCIRRVEISCSALWKRKLGDGACVAARANIAFLATTPPAGRANAEAACRASLPELETQLKRLEATPDASARAAYVEALRSATNLSASPAPRVPPAGPELANCEKLRKMKCAQDVIVRLGPVPCSVAEGKLARAMAGSSSERAEANAGCARAIAETASP